MRSQGGLKRIFCGKPRFEDWYLQDRCCELKLNKDIANGLPNACSFSAISDPADWSGCSVFADVVENAGIILLVMFLRNWPGALPSARYRSNACPTPGFHLRSHLKSAWNSPLSGEVTKRVNEPNWYCWDRKF